MNLAEATAISNFMLTWSIALTLFRKGVISKDDLIQTLDLQLTGPTSPEVRAVLSELKEKVRETGVQ